MTVFKYYIGAMGPYLYDDTVDVLDPDGDFPGETQNGFLTDGGISVGDITLNGATASRLIATDGSKKLVSVADLTSWILGITGDIIVSDDGDGTVTISEDRILESFNAEDTVLSTTKFILAEGTFDLFLPTLSDGDGRIYEIKNIGSGIVSLKPNSIESAKTIDEETQQDIRSNDSLTVYGEDANDSWWII